jgi:hypothetical protein
MRVLFGIILGVFLTIGFAYVYDASTTHTSAPTAQGEQSTGTKISATAKHGAGLPFE